MTGISTIGDSAVTSDAGWGAGFCADTKGLANCTNLAVSETTTVTWKGFPQYETMLSSCETPETWATIQFGYNDHQSFTCTTRPPITLIPMFIVEKVVNTSEFSTNLESLTLIIKDAGCKPILVTSLAPPTVCKRACTDGYSRAIFERDN
ncbi:hypothetical protein FRC08_010411 [Ceratobasidium sp. 394]|nr:hypothetical protein FRC08_010411 [Ceratobasidium sp. 394]